MKVFRFFSTGLAVLVGLIPAAVLFTSSRWMFEDIGATASVAALRTASDPFVIDFSASVDPESIETGISVEPSLPYRTEWNETRSRLSITPLTKWTEGARYRVSIGGGGGEYFRSLGFSSFSFEAPGYPTVVSIAPAEGAKDVRLGIEDPITVRFDRTVRDFYVDFRLTPSLPVVYENDAEKTEFKLLPKEPLVPGTVYRLDVFAKWSDEGDDRYVKLGGTEFTTLPERPKELSRDFSARLEEAKRFANPIIREGKYIDIDLSNQVMTLYENGAVLDAYLVSSGLRGMDTPMGRYQVHNKARKPWSRKYELYMPFWMAITSDGKYGIHELPEWPGGYKEGANHLGIPVSHGCVRLGVGPAERVWNWADIGIPVIVH